MNYSNILRCVAAAAGFAAAAALATSAGLVRAEEAPRALAVKSKVIVGGAPIYAGGTCANLKATRFVASPGVFGKVFKIIDCGQSSFAIVKYKSNGVEKISAFSVEDLISM